MRYPLHQTGPFWVTISVGTVAMLISNCSADDSGESAPRGGAPGMTGRGGSSGSPVDAASGGQPGTGDAAGADAAAALEAGSGGAGGSGGTANESVCGDLVVEPPEQCEDGNDISGDGCENDCRYTCVPGPLGDNACNDRLICNGTERCRGDFTCEQGNPPPDGTRCGDTAVCQGGMCVSP